MIENFDDVFEGQPSIEVRAREYNKVDGSSDTRHQYDEI